MIYFVIKLYNNSLEVCREARKIFRLFRILQETKNINDKLKDFWYKNNKIAILLEILSKFCYLVRWIFDNYYIIGLIRHKSNEKLNKYLYIATVWWLFGIIASIAKNLYEILLKIGNNTFFRSYSELLEILGKLGDLVVALSGLGIFEKFFHYKMNEGIIGMSGLISAIVMAIITWNKF